MHLQWHVIHQKRNMFIREWRVQKSPLARDSCRGRSLVLGVLREHLVPWLPAPAEVSALTRVVPTAAAKVHLSLCNCPSRLCRWTHTRSLGGK